MRREFFSELLGTFVLMLFGLGVNAQVTLGDSQFGDFFSINVGWGIAVTLGVYAAGVTGGHLNPAVTIAMFVRGAISSSRVLPYIGAQLLGALLASALVFGVYSEQLGKHEAALLGSQASVQGEAGHLIETAGIWATYPREYKNGARLSNMTGLIDQVVGTAILLLCVCALTDQRNLAPQSNLAPLLVGSIVLMIGMSFGSNCGYAINPARDFGPRLFTAMAGWGGAVFATPNQLWWLVPIIGPIVGGIVGVLAYDQLITRWHPESSED